MTEIADMIVTSVGKLSLFKKLDADQVVSLLSVCQVRGYTPGEVMCDAGTDSTEMFLLISGVLSISTKEGVPIAALTPVTIVGEIGIITGQPRTATVKAVKESEVFIINKRQFEELVQEDENMGVKVYRNTAHSLCEKIVNDNVRTRDYYLAKSSYEMEKVSYERKIADYENQVEALRSLLAERGMSEEEMEREIEKRSE